MPWVLRGLRQGVVTTRYPGRPDPYFDAWHGVARVRVDQRDGNDAPPACPTGAIARDADSLLTVDQGRCIGCGRCMGEQPERFEWQPGSNLAGSSRSGLVVPQSLEDRESLIGLRQAVAEKTRAFGRSIHLRHVDAGSDGSEEWEIAALLNPDYDVHRLGFFFTASPRHADILLVTGIGAAGMREPLRRTLDGMPRPTAVVAVGTDACSGGLFQDTYAGFPGIGDVLDVDVWVPGSPPSPFAILHGLLLALGRQPDQEVSQR